MKYYETPWTVGALFICNKCGKAFDKPDQAEKLKSDLRTFLKESDNHKKIRVMVSGCLNVCNKQEQAICYQPIHGTTEVFTVEQNYDKALKDLKNKLEKNI